jgi:UDP-3-O-[3-hydroxymyristoyl] glucosamine N-acyltransferase
MKLKELAARLGLELRGDGEIEIGAPAAIEAAGPGSVTFVATAAYLPALRRAGASCAILPAEFAAEARCAVLISRNPSFDFARVLEIFFPAYRPPAAIDPSAQIAPGAKIGPESSIGAYCVIGEGAVIGRAAVIHPHVTIYPGVRIGDHFVCHSQVSIREGVTIGNHVTVLNGAVIGAEGFGYVEHEGDLFRIPQIGGVMVEDYVEIGANTTIDRATVGATIIRRGVKLDNLIQIGHNCEVGEYSRFAAQVGLGGSTRVGKWCQFGGQTGCADHVTIGDRAKAAAQSGIPNDVAADTIVGGTPAIEVHTWRRMSAAAPRLPELLRRVRALEKRLDLSEGKAQE